MSYLLSTLQFVLLFYMSVAVIIITIIPNPLQAIRKVDVAFYRLPYNMSWFATAIFNNQIVIIDGRIQSVNYQTVEHRLPTAEVWKHQSGLNVWQSKNTSRNIPFGAAYLDYWGLAWVQIPGTPLVYGWPEMDVTESQKALLIYDVAIGAYVFL